VQLGRIGLRRQHTAGWRCLGLCRLLLTFCGHRFIKRTRQNRAKHLVRIGLFQWRGLDVFNGRRVSRSSRSLICLVTSVLRWRAFCSITFAASAPVAPAAPPAIISAPARTETPTVATPVPMSALTPVIVTFAPE
jgi:hypothetical protein